MSQEQTAIRNVLENYGPRSTDMSKGGKVDLGELVQTAIWDFDYNDLPVGATNNLGMVIPANSTVLSARLRIVTAFTSTSTTTDLTLGLEQEDGTDIDVDGFVTAAQATQTTIQVVGSVITGTGALVGATIGAAAGELVVIPSVADLLTGRGQLIVEYLVPAASPA